MKRERTIMHIPFILSCITQINSFTNIKSLSKFLFSMKAYDKQIINQKKKFHSQLVQILNRT